MQGSDVSRRIDTKLEVLGPVDENCIKWRLGLFSFHSSGIDG